MGGNGEEEVGGGIKPVLGMLLVQMVLAGTNIMYKLALNDGMDVSILVAYRYVFATCFLFPLAFFLERKRRPTLTWNILMHSFLCGLFGGALGQNLYINSIKFTSATFASAMANLIPAVTFVLAVTFGLERLNITKVSGQAKVLGTLVGIGGAMTLTFYKGAELNLWSTNVNLLDSQVHRHHPVSPHHHSSQILGLLMAIGSCFAISLWMIIQAKMNTVYPCVYSSTALMCFMGMVQAIFVAVLLKRDASDWKMGFDIRLLTVAYSGIVASGLIFTVMAWCICQRGPLFATVFNPLMLVIVAVVGSLLINEKLHAGSVIGAVLIVIGLYLVLWGKGREASAAAAARTKQLVAEGPMEPLEAMVVDGISISRAGSLARAASLARVASISLCNEQRLSFTEKV